MDFDTVLQFSDKDKSDFYNELNRRISAKIKDELELFNIATIDEMKEYKETLEQYSKAVNYDASSELSVVDKAIINEQNRIDNESMMQILGNFDDDDEDMLVKKLYTLENTECYSKEIKSRYVKMVNDKIAYVRLVGIAGDFENQTIQEIEETWTKISLTDCSNEIKNVVLHDIDCVAKAKCIDSYRKRVSDVINKGENVFNSLNSIFYDIETLKLSQKTVDYVLNNLSEFSESKIKEYCQNVICNIVDNKSDVLRNVSNAVKQVGKLNISKKNQNGLYNEISDFATEKSLEYCKGRIFDIVFDKNKKMPEIYDLHNEINSSAFPEDSKSKLFKSNYYAYEILAEYYKEEIKDIYSHYANSFSKLYFINDVRFDEHSGKYFTHAAFEIPIVSYDTSLLGGGDSGFTITDRKMYYKSSMQPTVSVNLSDISFFSVQMKMLSADILLLDKNQSPLVYVKLKSANDRIANEFAQLVLTISKRLSELNIERGFDSQCKAETKESEIETDINEVLKSSNEEMEKNYLLTNTNSAEPSVKSSSISDELRSYKSLLDDGVITQEDYDLMKKKLLGI